jgi:hypothetical protein
MQRLVINASVALKWFLPNEPNEPDCEEAEHIVLLSEFGHRA